MPIDPATRKVTPLAAPKRVSSTIDAMPDDACHWSDQMRAVAMHGDMDAFLRIHDHYAPRLKRYLLGHGVAGAQADDLVQDAMLRLWRSAAAFDPARASLSTWLFRIVRNLQIDARRRSAHRDAEAGFPDGDDGWAVDEDGVQPDAYADHVGLDRAIRGLPAAQARLIRMAYLEARSHSEIAAELGMPLGSVKSTLRRAFARLKAGLGAGP
ncbi:sigma-70 family RNA polymerase sigma factor [Pseudoxanthomonas sp. 10H]|uniref:sigma-70 family RNA polymerase sigma factor n=1 Tax=Pseudoxanthomonas sp. 10H TaxID=3242729 RepID=UPI0035584CDC